MLDHMLNFVILQVLQSEDLLTGTANLREVDSAAGKWMDLAKEHYLLFERL